MDLTDPGAPAGSAALGGTTRLSIRVSTAAARDSARASLGPLRAAWLGTRLLPRPGDGPLERYALDLEMPLGDGAGPVALRKAALVDVGPLTGEVAAGPLCVLISWQAASLAPLFPVFSGSLCWSDGVLEMNGYYAPPGGRLGIAADRILSRLVAQRTARWLLGRVAHAMDPPGSAVSP